MTSQAWSPSPKPTDYRFMDLTGREFGRLTVTGYAGRDIRTKHYWFCRCECGQEPVIRGEHLRSGAVRSCRCWRVDVVRANSTTHGATVGGRTPEYRVWMGMRERCLNPGRARFDEWGGRGISVCDRWADFPNFLADMGPRPSSNHSIDRIDNDGNYEPGNCRWATAKQQANNRRERRRKAA